MSETEQQSFDADTNAKLLQKLEFYQTELEIQNESLRQTQIALEKAHKRYTDLYDFAPVAYLVLTKQGLIEEINLTGATLLGLDRQKLLQRRFAGFVSPQDSDRWHLFFTRQIEQQFPQVIELALKPVKHNQRYVQLDCILVMDEGNLSLRITLTDITAFKQAERVRYDSEAYQSILATTQDGFCILNAEGRLIDVNRRYCDLSGYSREELRGMSINDLNALDNKNDAAPNIHKIIENGTGLFETVHRCKDGTTWPVEISVSYRNLNGGIFYAFLRDITQRKQTENALKTSEAFVSSVLDSLDSQIAVLDAKGTIINVNKAWQKFTRQNALSATDYKILGCNYLDVCAKALEGNCNDNRVVQIFRGVTDVLIGAQTGFEIEYPCHSKNEQRWFYMSVSPLQGASGGVVVSHQNITKLKLAEQATLESHNLLRTVIDTMPVRIFWKDRNSRFLGCNKAVAQDNNVSSPQELIGKDVSQTIWAKYAEIFHADDRAVMESGIPKLSYDELVETEGVEALWGRTSKVPLKNQAGEIIGLVGFYEDITERKRTEQQLQESEQKLAAIFNILDVGIAVTDAQGNIINCNQRSEIILGLSKEEHLQRNYADKKWQIIRPDFSPMPPEEFASVRALKSNTTVSHVEMGIVKKDKEITWLLVTATPLQIKGYGVVITYIDITDIKRQKQVIAAGKLRFCSLIDISPVPMALNDKQQNITYLNPAFIQTFGYDLTDIPTLADWWLKAYPDPAYREWVSSRWRNLLIQAEAPKQKEFTPIELVVRCKNGSEKNVLITATAISETFHDEHLIVLYDISTQKQAEAVLLKEQQHLQNQVINSQEELEKVKVESKKINTALDVILNHRETGSNNEKNKLLLEMEGVVLPLFKKIKSMSTDKHQGFVIDLLETHLQELSQSYGREADRQNSDYQQLTPTEMQVALLIRQGLATKVIASLLNISPDTVCTHRKHIRKKLKLDGKPSHNLRNHLMSLLKQDDQSLTG